MRVILPGLSDFLSDDCPFQGHSDPPHALTSRGSGSGGHPSEVGGGGGGHLNLTRFRGFREPVAIRSFREGQVIDYRMRKTFLKLFALPRKVFEVRTSLLINL